MMYRLKLHERGQALVSSIFVVVALMSVSAAYLLVSYGAYEGDRRDNEGIRARCAAEEAINLSIAELKVGVDTGGDGLGNLTQTGDDGRELRASVVPLGGDLYRLHGVGELRRARAGYDAIVQVIPGPPLMFPFRAAIAAEGAVNTLGNISVDGRNWNSGGTSLVGPGVFGISSRNNITNGGSSTVGGNGFAPSRPPNAATLEKYATWKDLVDNDGDGSVDEELFDGIDNDHDGVIDEDTQGYPTSPDVMFKLSAGTLKQTAQANGTYFASQTAYENYRAAHGGNLPGGEIYYLDFATWQPANLSSTMNATPSIIIQHAPAGNALMKNVHFQFKGLVLGDFVEHINGDFLLVGAFMSFGNKAIGNAFGNGNATIRFSSAVLGQLPSGTMGQNVRIVAFQRATAN